MSDVLCTDIHIAYTLLHNDVRGLFDKFVENVNKTVSVYSILLVFVYNTGQFL